MALDIAKGLRAISDATALAQRLYDLASKIKNAELLETVADLRVELANAKNILADATTDVAELKEENRKLIEEVRRLEAANKPDADLIRNGDLYYKESGEGPFCPNCYLSSKRISLLGGTRVPGANIAIYHCSSCNWKTTKA